MRLCECVWCVKLWKYQEHFSNFSAHRSPAQLTPPGGSPFSDSTYIVLHSSKCQHLLKAVRVTEERRRDSAGQGEVHISEKRLHYNIHSHLLTFLLFFQETSCVAHLSCRCKYPLNPYLLTGVISHRGWEQNAWNEKWSHFIILNCLLIGFSEKQVHQ